MFRGQTLLRSERRQVEVAENEENAMRKLQLERTLADCVRMVPFMAFILIPMAEFALPFYLKLFPNALPSTFSDERAEVRFGEVLAAQTHTLCRCKENRRY